MGAYILVFVNLVTGQVTSQQEYANIQSCQNAGAIVERMIKDVKTGRSRAGIDWACLPKDNRTN